MFHKRKPKSFLHLESTGGKQLLKRAVTLSAGIFFLWIALQIMPKPAGDIPSTEVTLEATPVLSKDTSENRSDTMGFLKNTQIVAGILLIGLIGYMYYRYKKSSNEGPPIKSLKTLNRIQLAPNQHLFLIECGQEALLIGATNTQITLLQTVPLTSLTSDGISESINSAPYSFTPPVSTHPEPGDFASLLHSYSSANTN